MELIAVISVGILIIGFAAGISWLALRVFFFALSRGLRSVLEQEAVADRTDLIESGRLPRLAIQ